MARTRVGRGMVAAGLAAVVVLAASACQVDLGTLGGASSAAYGINDAEHVVGDSLTIFGPGARAFVSDPANKDALTFLSVSDESASRANDVNDRGDIVGSLLWPGPAGALPPAAWARPAGGSITALRRPGVPFPSIDLASVASAVNDAGIAVGFAQVNLATGTKVEHAVSWDIHTGAFTDLDGTTGASRALGINDAGQIVGWSSRGAFLWDPARPGMQLLPGSGGGAAGINGTGDIVGWVVQGLPAGSRRMARWDTTTGALTVLPGLGEAEAELSAVNDRHEAAGSSRRPGSSETHALRVALPAGEVTDLGSSGATSHGRAINAVGTVAGDAVVAGGAQHAFKWTR
jgi:uncharacterized membrane protein